MNTEHFWLMLLFFSCNQAALKTLLSDRPSVRPPVTPFSQCSSDIIIMKLSRVITNDKSDAHSNGQGQASKVKVEQVKTLFSRFQTVTTAWIHWWLWNDMQSLKQHRRDTLLFFKVIRQIRGHTGQKSLIFTRIEGFQTLTHISIHRYLWNDAQSLT